MVAMRRNTKKRGLKSAARVGDVFRIPISDKLVGYGQLVENQLPNSLYMAIFKSAYSADDQPDLGTITADEIQFLAHSFDALIRHGDWPIVGKVSPDLSR